MRGIAALIVVALALPLGALPALGQMSDSASQQKNPTGATAITPGQNESQAAERERKEMPATLETDRSAPGNATGGLPGGPAVPKYPLEKKKQTRDGQTEGAAGANPIYR